jgi:hypothetical protein
MLLTFDRLRAKPTIFKTFTGVSVSEFETLLTRSTPLWVECEQQRLTRPNRQRALGGGCKPKFGLRDQLLVTLVWLRLYLGTETLGFLFGIDKATVSRYTRAILPVLRQVGDSTLGWLEAPKRGQSQDLATARATYPDLFAIVDATEQPVERSQDAEQQKQHYSGKKKRHTRKVQIIVNEHGVVREVSDSVPGAVHDRELFRQAGAAAAIPKETVTGGDAGYQGIQDDLPDHSVITPFKKSKLHPLTEEQQLLNQEFSRSRIIVENVLAQFKNFKALAERFRHDVDRWDDVFRAVLAIINPRTLKRLAAPHAA